MNFVEKVSNVLLSNMKVGFNKMAGNRIYTDSFISLVSPGSILKTEGKGSSIRLGFQCDISPSAVLSASEGGVLSLGSKCFVNRNCIIASHEKIKIGDNVKIGPGTYIYDHDHAGPNQYKTKPIIIEDNVWIGAGCIILKGVKIGKNSVISAGSVITKDVPEDAVIIQKRKNDVRCLNSVSK